MGSEQRPVWKNWQFCGIWMRTHCS